MPQINEPSEIRAILETDRAWSAYALGDLHPPLVRHCTWHRVPGGEPALVLIYRGFPTPVLFALGSPEAVAPLLDELGEEPSLSLHVRPEIAELVRGRYDVSGERPMWRMLLDPARYRPAASDLAVRLRPRDAVALRRLYADGAPAGEAPEFFDAAMLDQGAFYGVRDGKELVAVAGTHLIVAAEGVAAVGNVYVRRDRRCRGLGAAVTAAVANQLVRRKLPTIVLNVAHTNSAAVRLYERLGFVRHCEFREGLASRKVIPTKLCGEEVTPCGCS